ncbi:MAG: phosphate acyltransferase PlsX, partial [Planctomycetota bacterium]
KDSAAAFAHVTTRCAVDVMGGDNAPGAILQGCFEAFELLDGDDEVILVGDEDLIRKALEEAKLADTGRYTVVHASEVIAMDESPVEAVRRKKDSSIGVMAKLVADGKADVAISAGNTGACVAASQLRMRTLKGVARPGIGVVIPTFHGPVVLCDAGANVEPQPHHLLHYGIMGAAYARSVAGVELPRVGLLSVGEESSKGNEVTKEAHKLLKAERQINFIGNIEGKDFFRGVCDVAVSDGFVGNVMLKSFEGLSEGLFRAMLFELGESQPELVGPFKKVLYTIKTRHDWQEYGGAPLLGVNGYSLICHGASEARAIKSAIRAGKHLVASGINQKIVNHIAQSAGDTSAEPARAGRSMERSQRSGR